MTTTSEIRQRPQPSQEELPTGNLGGLAGAEDAVPDKYHPSGKESHGWVIQILRVVALAVYFTAGCCAIVLTQLVGSPLYFVNRDLYDAYMALTKESFGIMITTTTQWWGPTTIRISGDASVAGQMRQTADGLVEFSFPERLVLIANHQIYTDWLYLWWVGYANRPHMHGHLYIILKQSLKYIPIMGQGMMFYGFIFMSRKMSVDRPRMAHRLSRLSRPRTHPDGKGGIATYLSPMWLLLFPEGTNASGNGRAKSARWADKIGVRDPEHVLLPRSTGMYFCLTELEGTVEWVYDCTVAYEGIPRGCYGESYFSLWSTYFQGRPPKSVNFYWRRFRVADIPLEDPEAFEVWLRERWYEKDALMEQYISTGRFPPSPSLPPSTAEKGGSGAGSGAGAGAGKEGFIETEVRARYPWEFVRIFTVLGVVGLLLNIVSKLWARLASAVSWN